MSKGTPRKTLGVAALGAVIAASAAGTASAAGPTDALLDAAADPQNLSVEDRVMGLPGDLQQAAGAVQQTTDRAVPNGQDPVGGLLGGLPVLGDLAGSGLPTDQLTGGLPTDQLTGGLPTDQLTGGQAAPRALQGGGLPTDQLSGALSTDNLIGGQLPTGDLGGLTGPLPL
ncbi:MULTISPECIES: hypothetical protein [unclassified Streptomyces]|uniref:hypothetical protein n=1 Tax=unclassified Streptomyces TaxID=2593676 RepID=UPI0022B72CC9|nr:MULTISPECIES: hypothetical protein [unclassified Streptomyces]MCZ7416957.1 hypothetical protein [Streptomyces sp. WMMC897]MCZ7433213.1 hypothetical protein [Streptomyces sp. WMMC1477]